MKKPKKKAEALPVPSKKKRIEKLEEQLLLTHNHVQALAEKLLDFDREIEWIRTRTDQLIGTGGMGGLQEQVKMSIDQTKAFGQVCDSFGRRCDALEARSKKLEPKPAPTKRKVTKKKTTKKKARKR